VEYARKKMKESQAAVLTTVVCLIAVPGVMAKEGWDDHDRSHRFTSRDFAYDYLNSCAPNAILCLPTVITTPSRFGSAEVKE